jgi:hypothetical protein
MASLTYLRCSSRRRHQRLNDVCTTLDKELLFELDEPWTRENSATSRQIIAVFFREDEGGTARRALLVMWFELVPIMVSRKFGVDIGR